MRFLLVLFFLLVSACSSGSSASAQGEGTALLVMGDSLSAGYGISEPDTQGWVALMEQDMRAEGFLSANQDIVNASVSGETSGGGLERLPDLLEEHDPHTVVIELGANDALRRQSMATLGANLREMARLSRDAGAKVVFVGIELPGLMRMIGGGQLDNTIDDAAAQSEAWVVDFPLADLADDGLMQEDRLHPTAAGQPVIRDALSDTIREAMAQP